MMEYTTNEIIKFQKKVANFQVKINGEVCRKIFEFDNYMISETARIYRIIAESKEEKEALEKDPSILYFFEHNFKNRSLKHSKHYRIKLRDWKGSPKLRLVAYLMAISFDLLPVDYIKNKYHLTYKDGNPKNLDKHNISFEINPNTSTKLTFDQVQQIKRLIELKQPITEIAKLYNVSDTAIHKIRKGISWNGGKILIPQRKNPIKIDDKFINKILLDYTNEKMQDPSIRRAFIINRNKKLITIHGIVNGYKFKRNYFEISQARYIAHRLNYYFFGELLTKKLDARFDVNMYKPAQELRKVKNLHL